MNPPDRPSGPNCRSLTGERRRWVIEESDWESYSGVELTEERLEFFRSAGASEMYLTVAQADSKGIGLPGNPVRSEIQKAVFYGDLEESPDEYQLPHDRFYRRLWEGNLYGAYCQGTLDTVALLETVFGEDRINAARPADAPKISDLDPGHFFICAYPGNR